MGCECLRPVEITKEIKTNTKEEKDNNFILKNDKKKEFDVCINTIKTSDKITFNTHQDNDLYKQLKNDSNINNDINNKIPFSSKQKNEKLIQKINNSNNYIIKEISKNTKDKNICDNKIDLNKIFNLEIKNYSKKLINDKYKNLIIIDKNKKNKNKNIIDKNNKNKIIIDKNNSKTHSNFKKHNKIKNENNTNLPKDEFSKYIFDHINRLRENPKSFIKNIEDAKSFITRNKHNNLIYKKNIKVLLSQGLLAFEESIAILQLCKPMNKLIFEPSLVVKLPEKEEDIKNNKYFKNEIKKMIDKGIPIQSYWRDIIREPETSFLMMVIDDTGLKSGLKRKDLLDPNNKYIGISSTTIGKHFVCFLTFSNIKN